jgi:cyanophycin synthetase
MKVLETQIYRGANYWASVPLIRFSVEFEQSEAPPASLISGLSENLGAMLPGIIEHRCYTDRGFLDCVRETTGLGHIAQHIALELQNMGRQKIAGAQICLAEDAKDEIQHGTIHAILRYEQPDVAIAAAHFAIHMLDYFLDPGQRREFDFKRELKEFLSLAAELTYGPSTRALVAEARRRDIPVQRLDDSRERVQLGRGTRALRSLLQLGYGKHQRRIWAPYISTESHLAADIALNKDLTYRLVRNAGLPVPQSIKVTDEAAAVAAAKKIGYPVVLKPLDGNHGRGVGINLRDEIAVRRHYPLATAQTHTGTVLVENFVPGNTYRVLVVAGRMVAVTEEVPAHVVGDGVHTLKQLVSLTNADPRRGHGSENLLVRIRLDDAAIALAQEQGYDPNDVPPAGKSVQLVRTAHISLGGISVDRTDEVHPYNAMIAEQAAQVIGLQVAGIDLLAPDIAQSVQETGGAICEVNAGPGLGLHIEPVEGKSRDVVRPIIELLFPPGAPSRVPIVAITGTVRATAVSRIVAHILTAAGRKVGTANAEGLYFDHVRLVQGDCSGPESSRVVLQNPSVETAVLQVGYEGVFACGLGYDRADVVVITDINQRLAGSRWTETPEDFDKLNSVVANSVSPDGQLVLNADDEGCARIGNKARIRVIYFTMNPRNPVVESHVRNDGCAVVMRRDSESNGLFVVTTGGTALPIACAPARFDKYKNGDAASTVAAVAAAIALNIGIAHINNGLHSFNMSQRESKEQPAFAGLPRCS